MIYYIFKSQIFSLFLSVNHFSAVTFQSKVFDYIGGKQGEFKVYELNKKKTLVFETKEKSFKNNFLVFLKDEKYHFNLIYDESHSNKDIEIKEAEKCSYFSLLQETSSYKLFECPKSLYIKNKKSKPLRANEVTVIDDNYLSKGPPLYIDGKLIYYQGRVL